MPYRLRLREYRFIRFYCGSATWQKTSHLWITAHIMCHLPHRAGLHKSIINEYNFVGICKYPVRSVFCHNYRNSVLTVNITKKIRNTVRHNRVQHGTRLIKYKNLRVGSHGTCDVKYLFFTARKLIDFFIKHATDSKIRCRLSYARSDIIS